MRNADKTIISCLSVSAVLVTEMFLLFDETIPLWYVIPLVIIAPVLSTFAIILFMSYHMEDVEVWIDKQIGDQLRRMREWLDQ